MIRLAIVILLLMSCSNSEQTAEEIVEHAIKFHGGEKFNTAGFSFKFRDKRYFMKRSFGSIDYRRIFQEGSQNIMDRYTNNSFKRFINGKVVDIPDSMATKYRNSVNSVIYFASLPFILDDEAVNLERLDDVIIEGKEYYKIRVTFDEERGGDDHEDIFVYWFNKQNHLALDFFAYRFFTDGGGTRFRVRTKTHNIEGIKLMDYDNFQPTTDRFDIENFDQLIGTDELEKISEIKLKDIRYLGSVEKEEQ